MGVRRMIERRGYLTVCGVIGPSILASASLCQLQRQAISQPLIPAGVGHWLTKIDDHISHLMASASTPLKVIASRKDEAASEVDSRRGALTFFCPPRAYSGCFTICSRSAGFGRDLRVKVFIDVVLAPHARASIA